MSVIDMSDIHSPEDISAEAAMKAETFESFVERERERLNSRLEEISAEERKLLEERDSIERELAGISAYVAAKEGRLDMAPRKPARSPRRSSGTRAPRGERRGAVLDLIKQHPDGLSRGQIIEMLGEKGNLAGERSISNALSALKKAEHVGSHEGRYIAS